MGGIEELVDKLKQNGLSPDMPILNENKYVIYDFLVSHWNDVKTLLENIHKNSISSLKQIIDIHDRVAIIDVGWSGKNIGPLVKIINELGIEKENISIYLLGSICKTQNAVSILSGAIQCYMFDASYNRDIHDRFCKQSVSGLEAIEKIFSAAHASFLSNTAINKLEFAMPEIENYLAFEEIAQGILEFCQDFHISFKKYAYLEQIRGYDAYIPIRLLFNDSKSLFRIIGNMIYTRGVSLKDRRQINSLIGSK